MGFEVESLDNGNFLTTNRASLTQVEGVYQWVMDLY